MNVLLAGGGGFLGRAVARILSERGHGCIVTTRGLAEADHGIESILLDVSDAASVEALDLRSVDVVCNLAARIHRPPEVQGSDWYFEVNTFGAERLAERCASEPGLRLVDISTGNAYDPREAHPTERSPLYPIHGAYGYLSSKVAGETLVQGVARASGMPVTVLRPSSIYGPGMATSVMTAFIDRAVAGEPLHVADGGSHRADFVHVDDVATCVAEACEDEAPGAWNVGSGHATSILELAHAVVETFGSRSPIYVEGDPDQQPRGFAPLNIEAAQERWGLTPRRLEDGLVSLRESGRDAGC